MRDPTRGGVATTLNEIVALQPFGISLDEDAIPVSNGVRQACELLGFDPLYLACEGRVILIVAERDAVRVLNIIRKDADGHAAKFTLAETLDPGNYMWGRKVYSCADKPVIQDNP